MATSSARSGVADAPPPLLVLLFGAALSCSEPVDRFDRPTAVAFSARGDVADASPHDARRDHSERRRRACRSNGSGGDGQRMFYAWVRSAVPLALLARARWMVAEWLDLRLALEPASSFR